LRTFFCTGLSAEALQGLRKFGEGGRRVSGSLVSPQQQENKSGSALKPCDNRDGDQAMATAVMSDRAE